jgi:hypothetical protein
VHLRALAAFEREIIRERTRAGLAAAQCIERTGRRSIAASANCHAAAAFPDAAVSRFSYSSWSRSCASRAARTFARASAIAASPSMANCAGTLSDSLVGGVAPAAARATSPRAERIAPSKRSAPLSTLARRWMFS